MKFDQWEKYLRFCPWLCDCPPLPCWVRWEGRAFPEGPTALRDTPARQASAAFKALVSPAVGPYRGLRWADGD